MFSTRINQVPKSFLREILKDALQPDIITFAGGLPNPDLFPVEELKDATNKVLRDHGAAALQYTISEGYAPLRKWIAERYSARGLELNENNILITTGSQQGLDLLAKVLVNEGDPVAIEEPAFFGAIQALTIFRAQWHGVPLTEEGADVEVFRDTISRIKPTVYYCVPTFQNPSGISYSEANRQQLAEILEGSNTILIEDEPYGELRFSGEPAPLFRQLIPDNTVLLGSASKIVSPSYRVGWLVAQGEMMEKLLIAKQAADLHTPFINQLVLYQYLIDNPIDDHIQAIAHNYGGKCQHMLNELQRAFPRECSFTRPQGGMFLWMTLPEGMSSMALFHRAIENKVAFVPGNPFYVDERDTNALRLSFGCSSPDEISEGVRRLAESFYSLIRR